MSLHHLEELISFFPHPLLFPMAMIVIPLQMEKTMEDKNLELAKQRMPLLLGLPPGGIERDQNITPIIFFLHRK